jgi:hypothetical protein
MQINNDNQRVATAESSVWDYNCTDAPRGVKLLLLTVGLIAIVGNYMPKAGIVAWSPLPRRNKETEKQLGIT